MQPTERKGEREGEMNTSTTVQCWNSQQQQRIKKMRRLNV